MSVAILLLHVAGFPGEWGQSFSSKVSGHAFRIKQHQGRSTNGIGAQR